jgi:DNA-binding response OmpR family regulator
MSPTLRKTAMVSELPKQLLAFVVDEEHILASTLAQFLRQEGLNALSFGCPMKALNAALAVHPDLLISDVALQPLSGIELAHAIRKDSPACKVLLFSSHSEANKLLEGSCAASDNFSLFPGPVGLLNLMEGIHSLIDDAPPPHTSPSITPDLKTN